MVSKQNGVHSKPSMNDLGWWWQKTHVDNIEEDIEDAKESFMRRFNKEPLLAIVWGPDNSTPIIINNLPIWQDPEVPQNVIVLQ